MSEVNLTRGGFSGYCSAGTTASSTSVPVSCADSVLQLLLPQEATPSQLLCKQRASCSCQHEATWAQHGPS